MIRVFAGYDERESIGYHAFAQSLRDRASESVSLTSICGGQRDGTTAFTYSRFLVPAMCEFRGWAIFCDGSDMLLRADIAELWALRDKTKAVQVVQHDYRTAHARKFIGTRMASDNADYPRKNWSSVILWNCEHPANAMLYPGIVASRDGPFLHRFSWLTDDEIGALPAEWNHLVRESAPNADAKLAHFTLGIPGFIYYSLDEFADEWRAYARRVVNGTQYDITPIHLQEVAA